MGRDSQPTGVEASSALRRLENIYYPPVIRTSGPSLSRDDPPSNVASPTEEAPSKDPPIPSDPQRKEEQAKEQEALKDAPVMQQSSQTLPNMLPRMGEPLKALN